MTARDPRKVPRLLFLSDDEGYNEVKGKIQIMKLAIFDIDGTIFRSSLVIELLRGLVRQGVFPKSADREVQKEYLAWLDRKGSYGDYINKVVKIYVKFIAGKPLKRVHEIARQVVAYQKNRTYRFTRDLIKKLKSQNYFLVAISGSPIYIVREYARATGFHVWFGTEIEIKKGKFTKRVLNLDPAYKKKKVLLDFINRNLHQPLQSAQSGHPPQDLGRGNTVIDWRKSIAVGDTETDISVLQMVGKPIVFNPNYQLAKVARSRGWRIIVERKDVIYAISKSQFQISKESR